MKKAAIIVFVFFVVIVFITYSHINLLFPLQTKELGPVEFKLLKFFLLVFLGFGFIILYSEKFFHETILKGLVNIKKSWFRFQRLEIKYLIFVCILVLVSVCTRLILTLKMPVHYDEALTYINFTKNGFLYSLTHYTSPNNHILHSLLTNLTYYLPFDNIINLRIPNLIVGIVTIPLFFYCFFRLINFKIAMFVTTIFSFLPMVLYYGFNSRGYSLIILFFLISFYAAIQIIRNKDDSVTYLSKYLCIFSISSIFGFYSIPSFLYAYIALISYIILFSVFQKPKVKLLHIIISGMITTFFVLLLYVPVFIVSGLRAITNNEFVAPISRREVIEGLYKHFTLTFDSFFSINAIILAVLISLIFCYLLFKSHKPSEIVFCLYILFLSPIILVIHSVIPFTRTWVYLVIPILYLLGMFLEGIKMQNWKEYYIYSAAIFFSIVQFFNFFNHINEMEKFSFLAEEVSEFLIASKPERILVKHPLIDVNLIFIFENKNKNISVFENDYYFSKEYDFLVLDTNKEVPKTYEVVKEFAEDLFVFRKVQ